MQFGDVLSYGNTFMIWEKRECIFRSSTWMDVFTNDEQHVVVTGVSAFHEQSTMVGSLFLWIPLFCFALFLFLSLSFSLDFQAYFPHLSFFFFDTSSRDTFLFFLNKPSIIELYENSNSLEFNIIAYHNFMRFIIFTIELSIVNLILSKQIYVLT